MKAYWEDLPDHIEGYGVPQDGEVFISSKLSKQRALLVTLHEVAELHRPLEHHCDIDLMVIDQIDCLQQLNLVPSIDDTHQNPKIGE